MSKWCIGISWDDCAHLTAQDKKDLWDSIPVHQRDARTKGVPQLGSGVIYPVAESNYVVDPFELPEYWPKAFALDVGWNRTAAIWGAWDRTTDTIYLYHEYYVGEEKPQVHAEAIKAPGDWIPGVCDPAARGRSQRDGERLIDEYVSLGLNLAKADNAVEAGIFAVYRRLASGRLKVFSTCRNFMSEIRLYRRDEKGKVVKERDHLMDACVVGDTMVVTDKGHERIADLVGREGNVLTRGGAWARYIGARKTIENSPIVRVHFDDGREVVCTPDHPFLTQNGWIKACEMAGHSCYDAVTQRIQAAQWKSSFILRHARNLRASVITSVASIFSGMASGFTGLFGPKNTDQFPAAMTSTTRMRTARIIAPTTWNERRGPLTSVGISRESRESYRLEQSRLQSFGTPAKTARLGTLSITAHSLTGCMSNPNSGASIAGNSSRPQSQAETASVPTPAKHGRASYLALTMKNGLAWFVAQALWQIATLKRGHARANALVKCRAVQNCGSADVYCLTVPGTHAFAVNGGLVVHNTRYLVMSGMSRGCVKPLEFVYEEPRRGVNAITGY